MNDYIPINGEEKNYTCLDLEKIMDFRVKDAIKYGTELAILIHFIKKSYWNPFDEDEIFSDNLFWKDIDYYFMKLNFMFWDTKKVLSLFKKLKKLKVIKFFNIKDNQIRVALIEMTIKKKM